MRETKSSDISTCLYFFEPYNASLSTDVRADVEHIYDKMAQIFQQCVISRRSLFDLNFEEGPLNAE